LGVKIEKIEMGGACSANGREEMRTGYTGFWWGNLSVRGHLVDPGIIGMIILRLIFRKWVWGYGLDRAGSG